MLKAIRRTHIGEPRWSSRGYGVQVSLLWEPRDLWVGVFWDRIVEPDGIRVFICLLPCLPIRLSITPLRRQEAR